MIRPSFIKSLEEDGMTIKVTRTDGTTDYVTYDNTTADSFKFSTDGGTTWSDNIPRFKNDQLPYLLKCQNQSSSSYYYIQEYTNNLTNGTFTLRQWAPRGVNPLPARYITATVAGWCGNQADFDPDLLIFDFVTSGSVADYVGSLYGIPFDDNMTWSQWLASSYATSYIPEDTAYGGTVIGWGFNSTGVYVEDGDQEYVYLYLNGTKVKASDAIVNKATYTGSYS